MKVEIWGGASDGKQFVIPDPPDPKQLPDDDDNSEVANVETLMKLTGMAKQLNERTEILGEIFKITKSDPLAQVKDITDKPERRSNNDKWRG